MSLSNTTSWYVVQFKPNCHKIAIRNLKRQDFQIFLPMHTASRRINNKFKTTIKPLFPGYMFIACDTKQAPWRQINSTFGVLRMLSFAEGPKPIPDALIVGLRKRCDEVHNIVPLKSFEPGEAIEVLSGPFANFIATFDQMSSDSRIWILLDFMGKATRVQVDRQKIQTSSTSADNDQSVRVGIAKI